MGDDPRVALGDLADPSAHQEPLILRDRSTDELTGLFRTMTLIRKCEEAVGNLVAGGEARCPCHLAIGQEATAVGVGSVIRPSDRCFGAHRSHGHYLALGGPVHDLFSEILGKERGCSHGFGGSMHLRHPEGGLFGTVPIVAATIPIAVGAALAAKLDGSNDIAVSFFGDGATEEGVFHESLNLASSMGLPILFVCENNLFSSHLHIQERQPADSISRYARAHRVRTAVVDGNDVVAVADLARDLVDAIRENHQPVLIEAVTYRWRGHVGHREDIDVGLERDKQLELWKGRDPIRRLADALIAHRGVQRSDLSLVEKDVEAELQDALLAARAADYPPEEQLLAAVMPSAMRIGDMK